MSGDEKSNFDPLPPKKSPLEAAKSGLIVRAKAYKDYSNTAIPRRNRWKFLGATAVVALVAAIALPNGESEADSPPAVMSVKVPTVDLTRYDMALDSDPFDTPITQKTLVVKSGDSLGPMLQNNGLTGPEAYRVTQAFAEVYKPRNVRVGQKFDLYFKGQTLENMTFRPTLEQTVFVERRGENYTARGVSAEFKYETVSVQSTIENSLYLDATRLGAPDRVVAQFANIYEYSVDFQRDIQPGDSFEMFFEVARDRKGKMIKSGDLLYTSFSPRGKTSEYYLYTGEDGRENFYDQDGKTAKRKLRATPINGARLSSSFGRRKHPILGYRKMHAGVDFAAPRGTPILAAGSGTVERANRFGSFGNYIRIRHTDGYKTAYAHLNGFARGIRAGKYVTQDQVIGYVGTTGRSTGPHLHYEVIHNGKKINPRRLSQLSGKPLGKTEMPKFKQRRAEIDALREKSEVIRPAAPIGEVVLSVEASEPTHSPSPEQQ
ncbi:murein DD-endopeptidase MepM/ murein hydrolase activator NlpD [Litorimonas taeanensis]|uniref:Murein DD-endopeptidase MepM/ murein hydrolase activator NlpD n=1 Tax=Litorimonas taeanensis TaxID=568099 RepID=A0A420WLB1_9PROT|nr:M23 family metallopeptidase [Litorimonas taeanensis]RKQ71813.1 murein DD-endopeptidase MepM/ murein hydrolase activator NlpD [Litorimonas taeanensis]